MSVEACSEPSGYVDNDDDCDDGASDVNPDVAYEYCNGVDDDCDGLLGESDPDYDTSYGSCSVE